MRYLPAHAQHIGSRSYQQDSFGFADPEEEAFLAHAGFLAVLCDGMGGMEHGDVASQTAVRAVLDAYSQKTPEETIPEALERSVRTANERVIEAALNLGFKEGVGTTLVATVLHKTSLYFFSVGDSGLFHVRNGHLQMVNRPHVFSNLLDQAAAIGKISRAEAEQHPERDSLTSFIGIHVLEEVDRNTEAWPVSEGDTILLASDGMFKTLEPVEIVACLKGHPQSWPTALVARTLAQGNPGQDNVTVVSVTFDTGALGDWIRRPEESVFPETPFTNSTASVRADSSPHANAWLIAAAFLLLVAIGLGGLWYFSSH
jgi:serine/threonine protein phosphatase PrpC